jgi:FkbM family methyltransferase
VEFAIRSGRHGYAFAAPDGDDIGEFMRSGGHPYEHDLLRTLAPFVRPHAAVVDVGANIGNHALFFAVVREASVHAFEPNPVAREWLRRNMELNRIGHIYVHDQALSDENGRASIVSDGTLGETRAIRDAGGAIEVCRLDDFRFAHEMRIAVLKIDVEGAEEQVLGGADRTIRDHRPLIAVEARDRAARTTLDALLGQYRYRRLPREFAFTPTYVYYPSVFYLPALMVSAAAAKRRRYRP